MDKATATSFVERIERHRAEEAAIWEEMRALSDYESTLATSPLVFTK